MTYRMFLIFLSGLALAGCGGVDDEPDDPVDTSTTASCLQDTWSRTLTGTSGTVDLTYEFLEDGTYIQRSYVDNISTAEYLGGVENTGLDLPVLPGLDLDVGLLLNLFGPFYTEGYFYTAGTWTVDESTGIITGTLPKNAFGHSVWSESGAKRDFESEVPELSQVPTETVDQYVYCTGSQLVVGAFYKEDDSDIAGLWDNLETEFYVADDYVGATQRFRAEDGDVYASNAFAMELQSEGYALRRCRVNGGNGPDTGGSLYRVTSDSRIVPTGGFLPPYVDSSYDQMLSDNYYYRLDAGLLTRVDIDTGDVTELLELFETSQVGQRTQVPGGLVLRTYNFESDLDNILSISDSSDEVLRTQIPERMYTGPYSDDDIVVFVNRETGGAHLYDYASGSLSLVPFTGASSVDAGQTSAMVVDGQLIVSTSTGGTLHQFWTYSVSSEQFELLAEVQDTSPGTPRIYAGKDGYDVRITRSRSDDTPDRIVYLSADSGYAPGPAVDLPARDYQPKGDSSSRYLVSQYNSVEQITQLYLLNVLTNEMTLVSPPGVSVPGFSSNDDGSRIIYHRAGLYASDGVGYVGVINIADNGDVSHQLVDAGRSGQFDVGFLDDVSAFYVQAYSNQGDSSTRFFVAPEAGAELEFITDEYAFGSTESASGYEFLKTDKHLIAQARTEYSAREPMLYNPLSNRFELHDLNPVPDVSSAVELIGVMGGDTILSAWNKEDSCGNPYGLLRFEGNYLWYESDTKGFPGVQWFNR